MVWLKTDRAMVGAPFLFAALEFILHHGQGRIAISLAATICCHPAGGLCRRVEGAYNTAAAILAAARWLEMAALQLPALCLTRLG
jgi:hypothetical protein